jgi:hypothetical protein
MSFGIALSDSGFNTLTGNADPTTVLGGGSIVVHKG